MMTLICSTQLKTTPKNCWMNESELMKSFSGVTCSCHSVSVELFFFVQIYWFVHESFETQFSNLKQATKAWKIWIIFLFDFLGKFVVKYYIR